MSSGLNQGCLLSPILFNLFVNDLILELEAIGCGIDIVKENVCILCYADDLVIISETAEGLQTMLDIVKQWYSKWSMAVNTKNTQIVHFRAASMPRSNYTFTYADLPIVISERYKYLGLILTEFLDYQITASIVARSAGRALGLVIVRYKAFGGLPYDCYWYNL